MYRKTSEGPLRCLTLLSQLCTLNMYINEGSIMREVNVTELRCHLHKYLESVQKGTEVLVTWHGEVIARILPPIDKKKEALNQLKELRSNSNMTDIISP